MREPLLSTVNDHASVQPELSALTAESAHVTMSRAARSGLRAPVIYATFDKDGTCRYVGKGFGGAGRPLSRHLVLDGVGNWTVLRIWRVNVTTDEELCALESQAIRAWRPTENRVESGGRRHKRVVVKPGKWLRPMLTTRDCADVLGVTPKFILGEIQDDRLEAVEFYRPSGRRMYRVSVEGFREYLRKHWPERTSAA